MKVVKIIISVICTGILTISLMAISGLLLVKGIINKDTIMNIIMPSNKEETGYVTKTNELAYVNTNEVAYTEEDLNNLDYNQLQSISGDTNKIHEILDSTFTEQGIPTEIIDYIVEDPEYQNTVSTYLDDFLDYQTGNGPKPEIDQTKVNEVLNNNIAKYETETGTTVNTEKVEEMVTQVSEKIDEEVTEVAESTNIKAYLSILHSKKLLFGLIINAIIWAGIIIALNFNKSMTFYLGTASLCHGIIYLAVKVLAPVVSKVESQYQSIIKVLIDAMMPRVNTYVILSMIVGIVLIAIGIILTIMSKKKQTETEQVEETK